MISTLARTLNLSFSRIQFTPDLMPADITGTEIIEENRTTGAASAVLEGPLFSNVILADEINRTPPKTQAALLEAMQERQVTVGRVRHPLVRSVLRAGHAEPDRAGRHLPAAGSPAGPLHVQGLRRLSELRRRVRSCPPHDDRCRSRSSRC
jgi:MoxR-like ATPase